MTSCSRSCSKTTIPSCRCSSNARGETQLFVKQVVVEGKSYIVCRNETKAESDRQDREAVVAALDARLKDGDKALIGNSAYRRYLCKSAGSKERRGAISIGCSTCASRIAAPTGLDAPTTMAGRRYSA